MSFSKRTGLEPETTTIVVGDLTKIARTGIYNALHDWFAALHTHHGPLQVRDSLSKINRDFFLRQVDQPLTRDGLLKWVNASYWYKLLDLIEFILVNIRIRDAVSIRGVEKALLVGSSGYRLIDGKFVEVAQPEQGEAITNAIATASGDTYKAVRLHLQEAVKRLAERPTPNHRGAIDEAVHAVEATARIITDTSKTLHDALKLLADNGVVIHGALGKGIAYLYGWAGDEEGLRHSLKTGDVDVSAEAPLAVVMCSALCTYLIALHRRSLAASARN